MPASKTATVTTVSILAALAAAAVTTLIGGWMLMLTAGIVHSYLPAAPLLGYWTSVGIFFVLRALLGGLFKLSGRGRE